ncbi:MAG: DNA-protecting protein DprA [Chloroflexi bacterium]|nr:DNA-protecting protein DprA [Chloroflexota bacterium]
MPGDEHDDRPYWVLLSTVSGIGPTRFTRLLELCGSARAAWHASEPQLRAAGVERPSIACLQRLRSANTLHQVTGRLQRDQIGVLTLLDDAYPAALREIADPPPVLFVRGRLTEDDRVAVALVGTRRATPYGRAVAERLAADLARAGITVVSGLARGIDTFAHRAALSAGGRTIAVLGSGLDQVYPAENTLLARRILAPDAGALVAEFPPGVPPDAVNFPRRNRIIAGLARATVIVEADLRSGALITAEFALEQGREVLAVPGSILSGMSAGPNELIRQGAAPATSADDILEALGLTGKPLAETGRQPPLALLDADETAMLGALGQEPRHVDELARHLGQPAGRISAHLASLEVKGLARQVGALAYVRT